MDDSSQQLDAWGSTTPPQKPPSDSGRTTGIILVAGIMAGLFILVGLLIGWTFGVQRPAVVAATQHFVATRDTLTAAAQPPDGWDLILEDHFDTDQHWPDSVEGNLNSQFTINVNNETLRWAVTTTTGGFWHGLPASVERNNADLRDFWLSVEAMQSGQGYGDGAFGIIFRRSGSDFYLFEIERYGPYRVMIYQDRQWETLIDWTETDADFRAPDKLTVRAEGSHFMFFINDQFVAEVDDDRLPAGQIGLGIEVFDNGRLSLLFDNMLLYAPPES